MFHWHRLRQYRQRFKNVIQLGAQQSLVDALNTATSPSRRSKPGSSLWGLAQWRGRTQAHAALLDHLALPDADVSLMPAIHDPILPSQYTIKLADIVGDTWLLEATCQVHPVG